VNDTAGTVRVPLSIDRGGTLPLYRQVADQLSAAIRAGMLKPGDVLENEPSLADRIGISRMTAREAMMDLVGRGLLVRRRGVGTVVTSEVIRRRDELPGLFGDSGGEGAGEGSGPVVEVLEFSTSRIDECASARLGLASRTPLVYLKRLLSGEDGPRSIKQNWLPPTWVDLDLDLLAARGLYQVMRARGVVPAVVRQVIASRAAESTERPLLHTERHHPILAVTHTSYDLAGLPLEFGEDSCRCDRYLFHTTLHAR
jgi:GntR family transcriptional regulator